MSEVDVCAWRCVGGGVSGTGAGARLRPCGSLWGGKPYTGRHTSRCGTSSPTEPAPRPQPELSVERVGDGHQRVERRDQRWMDTPGAVVEGMVELVGQRAGGAEPPGVQVPLVAAPRAVDPRGFIARVLRTVQVTAGQVGAPSRRSPRRGRWGFGLGGRSH